MSQTASSRNLLVVLVEVEAHHSYCNISDWSSCGK